MRKGDWKECWSVHAVGRNLAAGKGKGGNGSRCEQEMRKGDWKECWSAYAVGWNLAAGKGKSEVAEQDESPWWREGCMMMKG